jgi:hypothetical protein
MVILAYRPGPSEKEVVKLLSDEYEKLRSLYCEDARDQLDWADMLDGFEGGYRGADRGSVHDEAKDDYIFAVAGPTVLSRAEWAFDQHHPGKRSLFCLKLGNNKYGYDSPARWTSLSERTTKYRLIADTPKWDDNSDIYDSFPRNRDSKKSQMLLGFHDRGIDPSEKSAEELRQLISGDNQ